MKKKKRAVRGVSKNVVKRENDWGGMSPGEDHAAWGDGGGAPSTNSQELGSRAGHWLSPRWDMRQPGG